MNRIDELLSQTTTPQEPRPERRPISQVYITDYVREKAETYAKLTCDVLRKPSECYGYLIAPKTHPGRLATDIFFAPGQIVTYTDVIIPGDAVISSGRTIDRMGYRVLGWWHSHADFEPFHSETDDANHLTVLNKIASTNTITCYQDIPLFGKARFRNRQDLVTICNEQHPTNRISLRIAEANGPFKGSVLEATLRTPLQIGFAYSLVINALGWTPYAELATRKYCNNCQDGEDDHFKSRLRIIPAEKKKLDLFDMKKEIRKKISRTSFPPSKRSTPVYSPHPVWEKTSTYEATRIKNPYRGKAQGIF